MRSRTSRRWRKKETLEMRDLGRGWIAKPNSIGENQRVFHGHSAPGKNASHAPAPFSKADSEDCARKRGFGWKRPLGSEERKSTRFIEELQRAPILASSKEGAALEWKGHCCRGTGKKGPCGILRLNQAAYRLGLGGDHLQGAMPIGGPPALLGKESLTQR